MDAVALAIAAAVVGCFGALAYALLRSPGSGRQESARDASRRPLIQAVGLAAVIGVLGVLVGLRFAIVGTIAGFLLCAVALSLLLMRLATTPRRWPAAILPAVGFLLGMFYLGFRDWS